MDTYENSTNKWIEMKEEYTVTESRSAALLDEYKSIYRHASAHDDGVNSFVEYVDSVLQAFTLYEKTACDITTLMNSGSM